MLSVLGTSFGFLPIYENAIQAMKSEGYSGKEAYGKMLGTTMVCALLEIILSFVPKDKLRRVVPKHCHWCSSYAHWRRLDRDGNEILGRRYRVRRNGVEETTDKFIIWLDFHSNYGTERVAPFPGGTAGGKSTCDGNGDVIKAFGSPEYIAMGFSVVVMLVLVEMFGSPLMKNANVIIALLFGYFVVRCCQSGRAKIRYRR